MINLNSLPLPKVLQVLNYEAILEKNITNFKKLYGENWQPLESDDFKMMLEAFAYRELAIRSEFNELAKAFFVSLAKDEDLDNIGAFYDCERLDGTKPYDEYDFEISEPLAQDIVVPVNLVLTDETSTYEAKLLEDVVITAGETKATGTVELQLEISSSEIKTEIITTPLPFVVTATAQGTFQNGSEVENDESFRFRILLSMADKSTAGSEETYLSFTYKSDERIEDVAVSRGLLSFEEYIPLLINKNENEVRAVLNKIFADMGIVKVYYYSSKADELMQNRIEAQLNAKEVRPLTDTVVVEKATEVSFSVNAELKILPGQETATVFSNAKENLNAGLNSLKKIGTDITLSEINDFLRVPGVKEVVINFPTGNLEIADNQIGICSETTITYTVI